MGIKKLFVAALLVCSTINKPVTVTYHETKKDPSVTDILFDVSLKPHEHIYENNIQLSVDHPDVTITEWKSSLPAKTINDPSFNDKRSVFDENFTLSAQATSKTSAEKNAHVHLTLSSNQDSFVQKSYDLDFKAPNKTVAKKSDNSYATSDTKTVEKEESGSWSQWFKAIPDKIKNTDSMLLRLLLVLLLGILLSLTPCIYPMIPITVGILQAQGSKSITRNFFLSLCYTLGLATTFSLMGLLAASSGAAFGSIMGNPIFVCGLVAVLGYFAFSMLGFYTLRMPRFLQQKGNISSSGSVASIFLFGMASGTVASPCLSPGLALVLAMVATLANKFLGFLFLFVFGIGISVPLLVIGTFSGSMNMLPKAGMWMIEVQKLFGFMLLAMCFYYLSNILPWYMILIMLTIFLLCSGVFYFTSVTPYDTKTWKIIKNMLGAGFIAGSVFMGVETFQEIYIPSSQSTVDAGWFKDNLKDAQALAITENKPMLIDFWAPYCSICKAITAKILKDPKVAKTLNDKYVVVMINASDNDSEPFKTLQSRYEITGVPNILVVDPHTNKEVKRWQSELYDMEKDEVIAQLNECVHS